MPVYHDREDLEFLAKVERLGAEGKTQEEIAASFAGPDGRALSRSQLTYRLLKLGYQIESRIQLRSVPLDKTFAELLRDDEIQVRKQQPALAGAVA